MTKAEDYVIDFGRIWDIVTDNFRKYIVIILLFGIAAFGGTKYLLPKEYSATATIVIVQNTDTAGQGITYNDVQLSQKLVSTYSRILMSETVGDDVYRNLSLDKHGIEAGDYKNIVKVSATANTEVLDVKATTGDPELSAQIANEVVRVFTNKIYKIMNVRNVTVLDSAKVPTSPSGPSLKRNTLLGLAIGIIICALMVLYKNLTDTKVKTDEEARTVLGFPIIGVIPEMKENEMRGTAYGK